MTDDASFLAAIRAAGFDHAPRLVYADWLDEHGQPDKAAFLRANCESDKVDTEERDLGLNPFNAPGHSDRVRRNRTLRELIESADREWVVRADIELAIPVGLSEDGSLAADIILDFLAGEEEGSDTGGCRAFYSPAEWRAREEDYGADSYLIVCHDGGSLSDILGSWGDADAAERLRQRLHVAGLFAEQCTEWYSAVYRDDNG